MSEKELCRLCAGWAESTNSRNLFETGNSQRKLRAQIEELLGKKLKNTNNLPQRICEDCQVQTQQAYNFCWRCIRTQEYFSAPSQCQNQLKSERYLPNSLRGGLEDIDELIQAEIEEELVDVYFDGAIEAQIKAEEEVQEAPEEIIENDDLMLMYNIEEDLLKQQASTNTLRAYKDDDFCKEEEGTEDSMDMQHAEIYLDTDELLEIENFEVERYDESSIYTEANYDEEVEEDEVVENDEEVEYVEKLEDEEKVEEDKRPFTCDLCEKQFRTAYNLKRHFNTHTGEATYPCKYCERGFMSSGSLSRHTRDEHQIESIVECKNYICDQCGRYFRDSGNFYSHMRRHAGDRRHHCKICPKKFFLSSELLSHVRMHTGEKPFPCQYCGRRFTSRHRTVRHERSIHLIDSAAEIDCNLCGKSFRSNDALREHIKTHSDIRNFKCETCNVSFKINKHLMQHQRSKQHKKQEILSNETT